jgi:hypothetical protein
MPIVSTPLKSERSAALRVPLVVESRRASAAAQPVTVGLPFPRGALPDGARLALHDADGRTVALQTEPLARWSDGSVKWLLLDFILPSVAAGRSHWLLQPAGSAQGRPALRIEEAEADVRIDTGRAVFSLSRASATLTRAQVGGRDVLDAALARLRLNDAAGQAAGPRVERVEIEARGPVRATVRLQGAFAGNVPCRFTARFDFFGGTTLVRVRLTVHNPNRARHPGGLWDLGDPGSMLFRDLSLEFGVAGPARTYWQAEPGRPVEQAERINFEIYQDSSGGANWQSRNHVNRDGLVPCAFRGYRVRGGEREQTGLRASPVVAVRGPDGSLAGAIPEFWQQFPKAIQVRGQTLRFQLFPHQFGDLHELQGGEQKTHSLWLHFDRGSDEPLAALDWVHQPAAVRAAPEWYARSGAVPFLPADRPAADERLDDYLVGVLEGPTSFFAKRERIDEYGWRNFGEVYADHEEAYCPKPPPIVSHYNNQFDVVHGLLLQFFRTGDRRWRELADPLARHVCDIDIYHTDQDKAAYNGGLFWFTDHYLDAGTCTHRTYSRLNCKPGASYGGGPDSQHAFATGLLHYFYLTGDPVARDAVLSLADWIVHMDDGRRVRLLGLLDDGPTGLASRTAELTYHGPGRGCGNSISVLLDGHALTGQRDYLAKAEELIRRSIHPDDDVAALDLLNAEKRWSYTVHLSALARYLDVKAEAGEIDLMYAYARASLLHYAAWMAENERPYFDRPEQLEFPTETWGAQELRKANVLRRAAAHAEGPLRSRLLWRAAELADRAWYDVLRFETRHTTRAAAVLMVEGTCDLGFRGREPPPAPRPKEGYAFGRPLAFVPQRLRVQARLKTVTGAVRLLLRLADPRIWRKFLA